MMIFRIRTPEDIFREEHRDVYALEFTEEGDELKKAMSAMKKWLAKNLPSSSAEPLAPSEHAQWLWLEGTPPNLSVNFADGDLMAFFQQWLRPDGQSKSPSFRCRFYAYSQWWKTHGHYTPTFDKPTAANISIWIETPLGILSHGISAPNLTRHPSTPTDLWANACKEWPQLRAFTLDELRYGCVDKISKKPVHWSVIWNAPYELWPGSANDDEAWQSILDWLCLPPGTSINSQW